MSWRIARLEDAVKELERQEPAVLAERVRNLSSDVRALKRSFYTFALSAVGSAVVFAFSVFTLLGHH